jgi:hypothetical protein
LPNLVALTDSVLSAYKAIYVSESGSDWAIFRQLGVDLF